MKNKLLILIFGMFFLLGSFGFVSAEKMWNFNNHSLNVSDNIFSGGDINVTSGGDICIIGGMCLSEAGTGSGDSLWNKSGTAIYPYNLSKNVGIGTTSPETSLQVGDGTSSEVLTIDADATSHYAGIKFDIGGINKWILRTTATDDDIGFYDGSAYRFYIDRTTGNVGIGTTSPDGTLDVNGDSYYKGSLNIGPDADTKGILSWASDRLVLRGQAGYGLSLGSNGGSDKIFIDTSGNVGIGTTTPSHELNVVGDLNVTGTIYGSTSGGLWTQSGNNLYPTTDGNIVRIYDLGSQRYTDLEHTNDNNFEITTSTGGIEFKPGGTLKALFGQTADFVLYDDVNFNFGNGQDFYIEYNSANDRLDIFDSGAGTGITIDNTGNVGIGDTTPDAQFTVYGTSTIGGTNLANSRALFGTTASGLGIDSNEIVTAGGPMYIRTAGAYDLVFGTDGGTERMRLYSGTGNLDVGGTVTATAFVGDGSGLTNIDAGDVNLASLTDGTGITNFAYDGTSAASVSLDTGYTDGRYVNEAGDTMTGALQFDIGGTAVGEVIDINNVADSDWAFEFRSFSVGNDNPSGFWVNSDGTPDMRLRSVDGTVRTLIDSNGDSYFNGGGVGIGTTSTGEDELRLSAASPQIGFLDTSGTDDFWIHVNSNNFYILTDRDNSGSWESPHPLRLEADTNNGYLFESRILTVGDEDGYIGDVQAHTAGGSLNMNSNSITGVTGISGCGGNADDFWKADGSGCVDVDSVVDDKWVDETGDTMTGPLNMNNNLITNIGNAGADFQMASNVYNGGTSNSRLSIDSLHTNGLGTGQIYIEGRAIDANTYIHIGGGNAGGQGAQDVILGNNNELYVDTSVNRVGVGTSGPLYDLDVSGNGRFTSDLNVGGDVGIGDTTPNKPLEVKGVARVSRIGYDQNYIDIESPSTYQRIVSSNNLHINSGGTVTLQYSSGSVGIGTDSPSTTLEVVGSVTATAFYYSSDRELKMDVKKINSALEDVKRLEGIEFKWKENGEKSYGLIAQEVEKVYPELVSSRKVFNETTNETKTYKTVQYGNLVAPLIESVKELDEKDSRLEKRIEEQDKRIDEQDERIKELEKEMDELRKLVLNGQEDLLN